MKKLLILFFVGVIFISAKAQNELPKVIHDINADVVEINSKIGNSIREYDTTFKRPSKIDIWIHDNQIKKIKSSQSVSNTVTSFEYYFKYGRLIYVESVKGYSTGDSTIAPGYFNYDELISQDRLIFEGKDTLFWGVRMQELGYALFDKYKTKLNYNPYKILDYDSVVAYDFKGEGGGSITDGKGKLDKTAKNGATLSKLQIDSLITTVTDTASYGGFTAACFDPHMGIVFYKKGKVVSSIDICFDCNYLVANEIIHASSYHIIRDFRDDFMINSPRRGFTPIGRKKLRALCSQLGLKYCPTEDNIWDKDPNED